MKKMFLSTSVAFSLLVVFAFVLPVSVCFSDDQTISKPLMTTWMPENGQTHEIGYLSNTGGVNWIKTWTVDYDQPAGSLLKTTPVSLNSGRYSALFQLWHKENDGHYLGELRAWAGDKLITSKPLISEEFPSYLDGGYQRAVLDVTLSESVSNIMFELWYGGNNRYIWTGAVNVSSTTTKRPFYNIAHRCSTESKVNEMIEKNANAIEFDITPSINDGTIEFCVYHSGDIFYTRASKFDAYLQNLKDHIDANNIALVELDCKQDSDVDPAQYARVLAQKLIDTGIPATLTVFSVPKEQAPVFASVLKSENEDGTVFFNAGIDSYLEDYEDLTAESWAEKVEAIGSTFIGVGITSIAISPMPGWMPWIQSMTNKRDANRSFKKAYYWTLNRKTSMRKCLDYGVDGIITNYPDRLDAVLKEEPYNELFRLATQEDSQFLVHGFE